MGILTTYSTLYNHPKLISEPKKLGPIQLSSKTGIPKDTLGRGLTSAALKQLDLENNANDDEDDLKSRMTECSMRPKHETKEGGEGGQKGEERGEEGQHPGIQVGEDPSGKDQHKCQKQCPGDKNMLVEFTAANKTF